MDYADERSSTNSTTGAVTGSCSSTHSSDSGSDPQQGALIFLHAGTYRGEFLVIDSDIALIGALPWWVWVTNDSRTDCVVFSLSRSCTRQRCRIGDFRTGVRIYSNVCGGCEKRICRTFDVEIFAGYYVYRAPPQALLFRGGRKLQSYY